MKGFLLLGVFSFCAFVGFYKAYSLRRRKAFLHEIGDVISRMGEEIRFSGKPLSRLSALEGKEDSLFGSVFAEGRYPEDRQRYGKWLSEEDWEVIDPFFSSLGKTDTEGQIKSCLLTSQRLSAREEQAGKENEKKCRLYSYCGVLAGLFFVIILL